MAQAQQLVLVARWPAPGRCKRRLAAGIGAWRAATVQHRLLQHGLETARGAALEARMRGEPIELVLALSGLGPHATRRVGSTLVMDRLVEQGRGSLGLRLQRQVNRARREGIQRLVLIGTDLPHLHSADLLQAFAALRETPLVLGPARDGGYWLIGLRPDVRSARLFAGAHGPIPWGSERVLADTLAAAAAEDLSPGLLAEGSDLDRPADLTAWR